MNAKFLFVGLLSFGVSVQLSAQAPWSNLTPQTLDFYPSGSSSVNSIGGADVLPIGSFCAGDISTVSPTSSDFTVHTNNNLFLGTTSSKVFLGGCGSVNVPSLATGAAANVVVDAQGNLATMPLGGGGIGDDLGNHTAIKNLNMSCFDVTNIDSLVFCNNGVIAQSKNFPGELVSYNAFGVGIEPSMVNMLFPPPYIQQGTGMMGLGPFNFAVNGQAFASGGWWIPSDRRWKKDIKPIHHALELVQQLNGVSYEYDNKHNTSVKFVQGKTNGFIAQDVMKIVPQAVQGSEEGGFVVNYDAIIPILNEAIKEQQSIIDQQQQTIDNLTERLSAIEQSLQLSSKTNAATIIQTSADNSAVRLEQNVPNPANDVCFISYEIPFSADKEKAFLLISNLQGQMMQRLPLPAQSGSVEVNTHRWASGAYVYSIELNGKIISSKNMMIQR
ncbi:MAG: tail fiber domain-containing protein [Sphingobacteriales bacterium]|nr:tail fiber domain-containing protein [Sphingobacteriales bacterium]